MDTKILGHAEKVEEELRQSKEVQKDSSTNDLPVIETPPKPPGVIGRWETIEAGGDLPIKFSGIAGMSVTLYQNTEHADSLLIMYGGSTDKMSGSSLSNLFVLDTTSKDWKWEEKLFTGTNHSPPELQWHTATIIENDIYFIFGRTHFIKWNCTNTVFAVSASEVRNAGVSWTQPKIEYPDGPIAPRYAHSATAVGKKIYVFGGCDGIWYFNDMSVFDTEYMRWSKIRSPAPEARIGHSATLVGDYIVIIGGYDKEKDKNQRYLNTILIFDTRTNEWILPAVECSNMPQGRVCHTANLVGDKIYVFGGFSSRYGVRNALQDLWYLDVSKLYSKIVSWQPVVTSGLVNPRYFHQTVHLSSMDVGQHLMLTIGGGFEPKSSWAPSQYLNQMCLLHLEDQTIVKPEPEQGAEITSVAPSPLSSQDPLPPAHRVSNELRRRNALSVQPLKWDELEWRLVGLNVLIGTLFYFVLPYFLPVIWNIIKMIAFIGGMSFCMCATTVGFYVYRYWSQVKLLSIYSTQLYDIYCETDGSLTAIATELVRGGLGPNAEERKLKTALGANTISATL